MGFILFLVAYILFFPLSIINYLLVKNKKGYFRSTALNIDRFSNREFRTLWNNSLIKKQGHKFGDINESISGVLGRNLKTNTLTKAGKILVKILSEKHVLDSITTSL